MKVWTYSMKGTMASEMCAMEEDGLRGSGEDGTGEAGITATAPITDLALNKQWFVHKQRNKTNTYN